VLETIRRILLTGDEAEFVRTLGRHLKRERFLLEEKCDYGAARRRIEDSRRSPFDLIVMVGTVPTPGMYEFLDWVKKVHPQTSVLLLSGIGFDQRAAETMRPDMDGHGQQPITPKEMIALIRRIDRNRRRISRR